MSIPSPGFRDSKRLTAWTSGLLLLNAAIALVAAISGLLEFAFLAKVERGAFVTDAELMAAAEASDARQRLIGLVQLVLLLLLAIFVLRWTYRAKANVRAFGAADLRYSPGWSVGWYFIPVLCFWRPYQAMRETWKASVSPTSWKDAPVPVVLPVWWALWVASLVCGNVALRLGLRAEELPELMAASGVALARDLFEMPLSLALVGIVRRIHAMQALHATGDAPP